MLIQCVANTQEMVSDHPMFLFPVCGIFDSTGLVRMQWCIIQLFYVKLWRARFCFHVSYVISCKRNVKHHFESVTSYSIPNKEYQNINPETEDTRKYEGRFHSTGLFISPSGISELDCATTKTDTAERSISMGRESLQVFFLY